MSTGKQSSGKPNGIDPELEKSLAELLRSTRTEKDMAIEDKLSIIDRALKLQALKLKLGESGQGAAWEDEES